MLWDYANKQKYLRAAEQVLRAAEQNPRALVKALNANIKEYLIAEALFFGAAMRAKIEYRAIGLVGSPSRRHKDPLRNGLADSSVGEAVF